MRARRPRSNFSHRLAWVSIYEIFGASWQEGLSFYAMNLPLFAPNGFEYFESVISNNQEEALLKFAEQLEFAPYVMRGQPSRRGIVRFGSDYGSDIGGVHPVAPIPEELIAFRQICATKANLPAESFVSTVVTRYPPGAGIGWHRDFPMFGPVVFGVSLLSSCVFKLREKLNPQNVLSITLAPRSLYVMSGPAREECEHCIAGVRALRYSITFRTLRNANG
jgi:alkylated DNA repair protein (DNA oxidative demethylase)